MFFEKAMQDTIDAVGALHGIVCDYLSTHISAAQNDYKQKQRRIPMLATVLIDNISCGEMEGEWGLSIYIEYNEKNILLDTGASDLFAKNAKKLGKSIESVDYAVLSHAHYDHSDSMATFFKLNSHAPFFLRKGCQENCYAKKWIFHKYIGLPKHILTDYRDRIIYADRDYEIIPGVYLIPHKTPNLKMVGKRESMYRKEHHRWVYDDFSHEQSLVFRTQKGLVIFNSCCHGGVANIINEVGATFPTEKVYGIIGGFHLFNKSEEEIKNVIQQIKDTGINYVCTGHCTKDRAYKILKNGLGDIVHQLKVGLQIEI